MQHNYAQPKKRPQALHPAGSFLDKIPPAPKAPLLTSVIRESDSDYSYLHRLEESGITLNEQQLEAVRHGDGPARIIAGAGSGKTRVLVSRTGYLTSVNGVSPKNILLLTFTRKAADEMRSRIAKLPGYTPSLAKQLTAGTFHSIFYRLLVSRGYDHRILQNDRHKQIAIKRILKTRGLHDSYEPETLLATLSELKSRMKTAHDIDAKTHIEHETKAILIAYEDWKDEHHYIDFDDMLLLAWKLLNEDNELLGKLQTRFRYILCDEWQDTNPIQFELIRMLTGTHQNLFVVGDDDQTIYSFNGADSTIILDFDKHYPRATTITLPVNYRSTPGILGLGNAIIEHNTMRHPKTLQTANSPGQTTLYLRPATTDDEAEQIVANVSADIASGKRRLREIAILHRTFSCSRAMVDQLVLRGIPFVTFGKQETFYESGLVKPVLDHLRLAVDPNNIDAVSGMVSTLYLARETTMAHIHRQDIVSPEPKLLLHAMTLPHLKEFQRTAISRRMKLIESLAGKKPRDAIRQVRAVYDAYLDADERRVATLDKDMVKEMLTELEASADKFGSIKEYLSFIEDIIARHKEMEELRKQSDADVLSLMTIHRAKGLEFPVVYVIGASETILPHSSALEADKRSDLMIDGKGKQKVEHAIEEERRLLYVAVTRAMEELYISSPSYYRGKETDVSRFLLEAFGEKERPRTSLERSGRSGRSDRAFASRVAEQKPRLRITALVWDCTSKSCNGWMRVSPQDESERLSEKACPLCKTKMKQVEKEITA
ncbi:UvrD-helicase domain-containing protein [Paenalkalicoccus suaedae]|uniref:DNA 3'-5' helicase n=1 Tax=Paenalkalicoccus suaedae TaxID=2592382 RepID=A0A859FB73_9BACI|nr:UvrD-helicase domain-containing protein [Paenalkalicoccus suaedae]QKS69794.1 UvrD-helicase domain-containing protein [Paenalkalicoccus suaedae]